MASSPEMEPPGFEHILRPPPPLSDSLPTEIESLDPASPDEAPPGFEKPNAWMYMPPPAQNKPTELPPLKLEPDPIGNANGIYSNLQEAASVGEETVKHPIPPGSLHASHTLYLLLPQQDVAVSTKGETMGLFQPGSATSDTINSESLLQPPKIENPMENQTVGPPEIYSSDSQKIENFNPAMLLQPLPPPPQTAPDASEQTLVGDGLGQRHRLSEVFYQSEARFKEETNRPVLKPEMVLQEEACFECKTMLFPSAAPESVSESLGLPSSPPPVPLVSESMATESGCENLDPVMPLPSPPPPPPALIVHDMPKSPALNSEYDNSNQDTCDRGLIGDEISSEHEATAPAQPPPLAPQKPHILDPVMLLPLPPPPPPPPSPPPQQLKCEPVVPLVPEMTEERHDNHRPLREETQDPLNQETEMFSCSLRDGTPDMLSSGTGPPVNQITDEPPLKKSRNMYETQGQLTLEESQPEVETDPFESVTPEMAPHEYEDMEQIDMDMSDDDTLDRSPTDIGQPGSDTRDSESLEEAPPGYNKIDRTGQMEMISHDTLSGELFFISFPLSHLCAFGSSYSSQCLIFYTSIYN
jgi:hypothetical protein